MELFEMILLLLVAVVGSSILEKFLPRVSLPLVQVLLGAVLALFITTPFEWGIDPELLLILFIAPLHFNESRHVDSGALWRNRWGIVSLSVGLVIAIAIAMGFTLHALLPAIPLAGALALGSAMGSTDAIATTGLARTVRFGKAHEALLKGEALFNDVTGTVMFSCCIAVLSSGTFSLMEAGEEFALDFFGGMVFGIVCGTIAWALMRLIRRGGLDNPTLHVMLELLLPFIIYLAAKSVHVGAVIAVVMAGMMMSILPQKHNAALAKFRIQSKSVWETLEFAFNGIIFIILGMQLPRLLQPLSQDQAAAPMLLIGTILLLTCVLMAVRFVWIVGLDVVAMRKQKERAHAYFSKESLRSALAMTFAGSKGGVTLSLMLTFPAAVANMGDNVRPIIISIAAGVIVCTLLLANFALPLVAPSKNRKKPSEMTDIEIGIVLQVMESIMEDAPYTGTITGDDSRGAEDAEHGIDEPATVIVLERYADVLRELAGHASSRMAERARTEAARVDVQYKAVAQIARDMEELLNDEDEPSEEEVPRDDARAQEERSGSVSERWSMSSSIAEANQLKGAIDDVQAQAYTRELAIIESMRVSGALTLAHARDLRNDVYIQQLAL